MTVPRFVKATPGHGEKSRYMVKTGTGKDAVTVGFVVCRVGEEHQTGGYWTAYTLYGRQIGRDFHFRRNAANALLLHAQQQP